MAVVQYPFSDLIKEGVLLGLEFQNPEHSDKSPVFVCDNQIINGRILSISFVDRILFFSLINHFNRVLHR